MKSLFNKYIWLQFILSILLLFAGALIIAFAIKDGNDGMILIKGLNIIVAIILFLFGLFAIVASFAFEPNKVITNGIIYGSASIAMGVFLCTDRLNLLDYLVYLLAIFFIVIGAIEIIKGIILLAKKVEKKLIVIISMIFGAIFVAGGILSIIFSDKVKLVFCIIAAVLFIIIGLYLLITGIITIIGGTNKGNSKPAKKNKEKENKKPEEKKDVVDEQQPKKEEIKELDYTSESKELSLKQKEE